MQGNQTDTRGNDGATAALTLATIHSDAELMALTPEWEALCAALPLQHPFAEPDWNLHWWRHLRARRMPTPFAPARAACSFRNTP